MKLLYPTTLMLSIGHLVMAAPIATNNDPKLLSRAAAPAPQFLGMIGGGSPGGMATAISNIVKSGMNFGPGKSTPDNVMSIVNNALALGGLNKVPAS